MTARDLRAVALFAVGYLACNELSFLIPLPTAGLAAFWPAAGLAVLAVARASSPRLMGVLAAVLVVNVAVHLQHGQSVPVAAGLGLANVFETAVAAGLLRAWRVRTPFVDVGDLARFCAVVAASAAAGAVVATVPLGLGAAPWHVAGTWLVSDGLGMLIVAPLMLMPRRPASRSSRWQRGEAVAATVLIGAMIALVFGSHNTVPFAFVGIPPLVWPALRLSPRLTVGLTALAGLAVTWLSVLGRGPFAGRDDVLRLQLVQGYVAAAMVTVMALAMVVHQSRRALTQLSQAERRFRGSFDDALLGMVILEVDRGAGSVRSVRRNTAAQRILGVVCGDGCDPLLRSDGMLAACLQVAAGDRSSWSAEIVVEGAAGPAWLDVSLAQADRDGPLTTLTLQLVDVTAKRAAEQRMMQLALYDELTGLPNRVLLRDRLTVSLAASDRAGTLVGLLFLDLDDFKTVNDADGHDRGDEVLREVAQRLQSVMRAGDSVARFGGDEFAVLCPSLADEDSARAVARRVLASLSVPIRVGTHDYAVGVSIGVALGSPASTGTAATPEGLMRQADAAMYAAKQLGKGRAEVFRSAMQARATRQAELGPQLQRALREGQFRLHYQPLVDLASDRITGVEALVRWQHPQRGLLPPAEFLDVAEQSDLVVELGRWVLAEGCRWAATWQQLLGTAAPTVHINISGRHLSGPTFLADVQTALAASGCSPQRLVLELTETHLLTVAESVHRDLEELRVMGIKLAADDYGTGYSPLSHVTELEVDILKIDKSFVLAMTTDRRSRAVTQAIIGLGNALGLEVVAEGVETREHADELTRLGCLTGQGYLWSPARPPDVITELLRDGTRGRGHRTSVGQSLPLPRSRDEPILAPPH